VCAVTWAGRATGGSRPPSPRLFGDDGSASLSYLLPLCCPFWVGFLLHRLPWQAAVHVRNFFLRGSVSVCLTDRDPGAVTLWPPFPPRGRAGTVSAEAGTAAASAAAAAAATAATAPAAVCKDARAVGNASPRAVRGPQRRP